MEYQRDCQTTLEIVNKHPIEIVRSTSGAKYIQGYAVLYYDGTDETAFKITNNAKEVVKPGSFDDIVRSGEPIELWVEHNAYSAIASTEDGSLTVWSDKRGIPFKMPIEETFPDHISTLYRLEKNWLKGASFRATGRTSLTRQGGGYIRSIHTVEQFKEISLVKNPAYKGTKKTLEIVRSQIDSYEQTLEKIKRAKLL